jgi:enoyl-CoA hydratase
VIELTHRGNVAVLRMMHGKANAMDLEFCEALTARLDECRQAPTAALVITGEGRMFSAGVDLRRVLEGGVEYLHAFLPAMIKTFELVFSCEKPVVAAVNGHAIAGGCILACAADRRIMARQAGRIGVPELLVGVPFPMAAFEIMRFAVPPPHFQALVYSGATVPAESAVERGLADTVVEPEALLDHAIGVAAEMAAIPADVFAFTKRQLREPALARIREAGPRADRAVQQAWESPATRAAIEDYVARTLGKSQV